MKIFYFCLQQLKWLAYICVRRYARRPVAVRLLFHLFNSKQCQVSKPKNDNIVHSMVGSINLEPTINRELKFTLRIKMSPFEA